MKPLKILALSSCVCLIGCQGYNPYVKNERREFYVEPTDTRKSFVYDGDLNQAYHEIATEFYERGMEDGKRLYSVDGKGGFYPHHQHQEMQIRYVDAQNVQVGAGIKVEGGQIPVLVDPVEWMESVGEPLPGTSKQVVIKKEEVLKDVMSGEMVYE